VVDYLLDTTVLIDYLRGHQEVKDRIQYLDAGGRDLGTCAISIAELFAGLRAEDRDPAARTFAGLTFVDLSFEIARSAGAFQYDFARRGQVFKLTDLLIGAAALAHHAVLLTDNVRDFALPGLRVERLPATR
jgi:tRNA(fMet)-specific endonuclease VapC